MSDHQRTHIGITELVNGDSKRCEHVRITDELLPIDLTPSGRLTRHGEHCFAPRRQNQQLRSVAQILFVPAVLRRSSATTLENGRRRCTTRLANVDQLETYSPLVTKVEQVRDGLTGVEA